MAGETRDLLGLTPYGEALNTLTKGAVEGAGAFLGRICLPVAGELGLLFQDKVRAWRAANAVKVVQKAEAKYAKYAASGSHAHPRLVAAAIENGSWNDSSEVQEMWAGLLASSCTETGRDEDNLFFLTILQQLTGTEVKLLNHSCASAPKTALASGLIWPAPLRCSVRELRGIVGVDDLHRLDRELDHLRALGLTMGGIPLSATLAAEEQSVDVTPTALAVNMYVRCQGSRESPVEFFKVSLPASQ